MASPASSQNINWRAPSHPSSIALSFTGSNTPGNVQPAALFSRLGGDRPQACDVGVVGVGAFGDHGSKTQRAQFGRLFDNGFQTRSLDQSDDEIEVRTDCLVAHLDAGQQSHIPLAESVDACFPLTVDTVENRQAVTAFHAHDIGEKVRLLRAHLDSRTGGKSSIDEKSDHRRLQCVRLAAMPKTSDYDHALRELQIGLVRYQTWAIKTGAKALVILEGRDGAGKDGTIARITEHLAPRSTRAVSLPKPSDREATQWYFQRYTGKPAGLR